jgi:hypothetical protein
MLASSFMTVKVVVKFFVRCLGTVVPSVLLATQSVLQFRKGMAVAPELHLALISRTWLTLVPSGGFQLRVQVAVVKF